MMSNDKQGGRPWFRRKRMGFGVTPQTWQGWAVTLAAVVVIVVLVALLR